MAESISPPLPCLMEKFWLSVERLRGIAVFDIFRSYLIPILKRGPVFQRQGFPVCITKSLCSFLMAEYGMQVAPEAEAIGSFAQSYLVPAITLPIGRLFRDRRLWATMEAP